MTGTAKRLFAAPFLVLALYGVAQASSLLQQDLRFTESETEVSFWGRGNYQPTEATVLRTNLAMNHLLNTTPHHPAYLSLQANSHAWQAYWAKNAEASQKFAEKAVQLQTSAVQYRPAHLQSRVKLAEYTARLQEPR